MKRLITALLVGGIVAAAVFGSAASITNTVPKLGGSSATVASCDTAVTTAWDSAYDATLGQYEVTTVTISAIATPACLAATLKVTLSDAAGAVLGSEQTAAMGAAETSKVFDVSASDIPAADLVNIDVALVGP